MCSSYKAGGQHIWIDDHICGVQAKVSETTHITGSEHMTTKEQRQPYPGPVPGTLSLSVTLLKAQDPSPLRNLKLLECACHQSEGLTANS